jgi:hypothetical protein
MPVLWQLTLRLERRLPAKWRRLRRIRRWRLGRKSRASSLLGRVWAVRRPNML